MLMRSFARKKSSKNFSNLLQSLQVSINRKKESEVCGPLQNFDGVIRVKRFDLGEKENDQFITFS